MKIRSRYVAPLIALLLLGQSVLFVARRLSQPSDGTRFVALSAQNAQHAQDGLPVTVLAGDPSGLRTGDVVVAVNDVPLSRWMANALNPRRPRPELHAGDTIAYSVYRGSELVSVQQTLRRLPAGVLFQYTWSDLATMCFLGLAVFLFIMKRDEPVASILLIIAATQLTTNWSWGLQVSDIVTGPAFVHYLLSTTVVFMLLWMGFLHFALIFPRPLFSARINRTLLPLIYTLPLAVILLWWGLAWLTKATVVQWFHDSLQPLFVLMGLYFLLTLGAMVASFLTVRDAVGRAQIRWVVWAVIVAFVGSAIIGVIPAISGGNYLFDPDLSLEIINLLFLLIPVAIVISVLRYRLFDIDIIIRRTTSYALLTALLAIIYFGAVVVLQRLLTPLIGDATPAVVLSTLLIAALFLPLRRRVQSAIDRRFFRRKYDAEKTLAAFAITVRNEPDLDALTTELLRVIQETMEPEHVSLWLRPAPREPGPTS